MESYMTIKNKIQLLQEKKNKSNMRYISVPRIPDNLSIMDISLMPHLRSFLSVLQGWVMGIRSNSARQTRMFTFYGTILYHGKTYIGGFVVDGANRFLTDLTVNVP